jgi:hypothetical protein
VTGLAPKTAHESGDGVTIRHCPFCGSGQVIGRSDGNAECSFCNNSFLVRVQPMYSAFPQSVGGMPVQIPGMPPPSQPGMGGPVPPGAEGDEEGDEEDGNPFGGDGGEEDPSEKAGGSAAGGPPSFGGGEGGKGSSDSGGGKDDSSGPPQKQSFRTAQGQRLNTDDYMAYLAWKVVEG